MNEPNPITNIEELNNTVKLILIRELGIDNTIRFFNQFLTEDTLCKDGSKTTGNGINKDEIRKYFKRMINERKALTNSI